jgi:hypothetical protein
MVNSKSHTGNGHANLTQMTINESNGVHSKDVTTVQSTKTWVRQMFSVSVATYFVSNAVKSLTSLVTVKSQVNGKQRTQVKART